MTTLDELTDQPELTVSIGGAEYNFSELTLECKGKLQAFIKSKVPHPVEAIKPHLEGLAPEDRRYLIEKAREDAQSWPPDIESAKGKTTLLGTDSGQLETLYVGLSIHQPGTTREQARRLMKALAREDAFEARRAKKEGRAYMPESAIQRIYACLFSVPLPMPGDPVPKAEASQPNGQSIGSSYSASLSNA